ncbi:unnamed protein product [Cuscuta epithymum]|uniref:Glutaredoxin domain-containing protein n=1 Tax=Cuscuta epithymum TaxID=186058 RepID=A0AAV0GFF6_9ASTE|nr:unnamed protein product [Cuscuta epithymum]
MNNKMASKEEMEKALYKVKHMVSSHPVVVFSKTYCSFCTRVKDLLSELGAAKEVIELDKQSDGAVVQNALLEWTDQRTVPNVFIAGKHVGGCDAMVEKHRKGELLTMLKEAGALGTPPAQPTCGDITDTPSKLQPAQPTCGDTTDTPSKLQPAQL